MVDFDKALKNLQAERAFQTTQVMSPSQANAMDALLSGKNVLLTGVAGTGKSLVVSRFVKSCGKRVAVTASTGVAAYAIGGRTLASWAGYGIGESTPEQLGMDERWVSWSKPRIQDADVLVIDEISMVSAQQFGAYHKLCCIARHNHDEPFGGLQVVAVGDFGQLPPVSRRDSHEGQEGFAFKSGAWRTCAFDVCELTEVFRQADAAFVRALSEARLGNLSDESAEMFEARVHAYDPDVAPQPTRIVVRNDQVALINHDKMAANREELRLFEAVDTGNPKLVAMLDKDCLSPKTLALKVGARVMFTRNATDGQYQNGTMGTVKGYVRTEGLFADSDVPIVVLDRGGTVNAKPMTWEMKDGEKVLAKRKQVPLRLAYAITVHKSQGLTLDRVSVNVDKSFEKGQAYVAVSRARTLDGLNIEGWRGAKKTFEAHPDLAKFEAYARWAKSERQKRVTS